MFPLRESPNSSLAPVWRDAPSLFLDETLEVPRTARAAQLVERTPLDLPHTLARHLEVAPHFLEGVLRALVEPEAHADHLLLARGEGLEELAGAVLQVPRDHVVLWARHALVLDE